MTQPENLSFSSKGKLGAGVQINGAYKILDINNEKKRNHSFVNLGIFSKIKYFMPEAPSLKEDSELIWA